MNIRGNRSFRNPRIPFLEDEQSLKCFRIMNLVGTHSEELPCITDSKEKDVEARITKHARIYVYTGRG